MSRDKDWDNAFTATGLHGIVEGSPSYAGAVAVQIVPFLAVDLAGWVGFGEAYG